MNIQIADFNVDFINTDLSAQFMIHLSTSAIMACLLASPYIIGELFHFISPALYDKEWKLSIIITWGAYILFGLGLLINYFIIFPIAFQYLGTYKVADFVKNTINLDSYISSFTTLSLLMGLVFEIPIIAYFAAKIGIINSEILKQYRKLAFVAITILSAIITPPDIFTCLIVMFPLYGLYEFSILIVKKNEE